MTTPPYFHIPSIDSLQTEFTLDADTARHVIQVLRMKIGDELQLTDGKGSLLTAIIIDDHKKNCRVKKKETLYKNNDTKKITIAISLLKNGSRFEWFLEKAAEIGVAAIIPLICERTEKQHFRFERMKSILISAMLQSQQTWLPVLHEPLALKKIVEQSLQDQKFIAHCVPENKKNLLDIVNGSISSQIILIGPEGDFTHEEIAFAQQYQFTAVALGKTRLRSETAAMVAATILKICS